MTIDLKWILRDLGLVHSDADHQAPATEQWSPHLWDWHDIEVEPAEGGLTAPHPLEHLLAVPVAFHEGGLLSQAAVFLRDRWRDTPSACGDLLAAGIGFLIGEAVDNH